MASCYGSRMTRALLGLALFLGLTFPSVAQAPAPSPAKLQSDLHAALEGAWAGVLEYRDYSEPVTSTRRETLPTWLTVTGDIWHIVYDDGPNKVIDETDIVHFDPEHNTYSEADNGKPAQAFKVTGYDTLKEGRGVLVFSGAGTDNDKPSERRITLTIRRNLLVMLEEVRPAGSTEAFAYRHALRFTRAAAPALTAKR